MNLTGESMKLDVTSIQPSPDAIFGANPLTGRLFKGEMGLNKDDKIIIGSTIIKELRRIVDYRKANADNKYHIEKICDNIGVTRQLLYKWISKKGKPGEYSTTLQTLLKISFDRNKRLVIGDKTHNRKHFKVAHFSGYLYDNDQLTREFMLYKNPSFLDEPESATQNVVNPEDRKVDALLHKDFYGKVGSPGDLIHPVYGGRFRNVELEQFYIFAFDPHDLEIEKLCYGKDFHRREIYQEFRDFKYSVLKDVQDYVPYWTQDHDAPIHEMDDILGIWMRAEHNSGNDIFDLEPGETLGEHYAAHFVIQDTFNSLQKRSMANPPEFNPATIATKLIRNPLSLLGKEWQLKNYVSIGVPDTLRINEFKNIQNDLEELYRRHKVLPVLEDARYQMIAGQLAIANAAASNIDRVNLTKSSVKSTNVSKHIPLYSEHEMFGGGSKGRLKLDTGLPVTNKSVLNTSDFQGEDLFGVLFTGEVYWNGTDKDGQDNEFGDYRSLYPKDTILVASTTEPTKNGDEVIVQIRLWKRALGRMEERVGRDSYISRWTRDTKLDDFVYCSDPEEIDRRMELWNKYLKDEHDMTLGVDTFDDIMDEDVMSEIWQKWLDLKLNEIKDWAYKVVAVIEPK